MRHQPLSFTIHFADDDDSLCRNSSFITAAFSDAAGSLCRYPFKRFSDYHKAGISTMEKTETSKIFFPGTAIRVNSRRPSWVILLSWILAFGSFPFTSALSCRTTHYWKCSKHIPISLLLHAKRNKNRLDEDDLNRWYDQVDEDATPDKVFWEEMERQRLLNQVNDGSDDVQQPSSSVMAATAEISSSSSPNPRSSYNVPPPMSAFGGVYGPGVASVASGAGMNGSSTTTFKSGMGGAGNNFDNMSPQQQKQFWRQPVPTMEQIKTAEATLAQYELFQVADNWIDEHLQNEMDVLQPKVEHDEDAEGRNGEANSDSEITPSPTVGHLETLLPEESLFLLDDEPWDLYDSGSDRLSFQDDERRKVLRLPPPPKGV
jgi:hypothetical protein